MALQQQSGFSFPMIANGSRGRVRYTTQDTVSLIRFSVKQIVLTLPGERAWNPAFGCRLKLLQFEAVTPTVSSTAKNLILQALTKWEPRVKVQASDITVVASAEVGSTLTVSISFSVINPDFTSSQQKSTVSFTV